MYNLEAIIDELSDKLVEINQAIYEAEKNEEYEKCNILQENIEMIINNVSTIVPELDKKNLLKINKNIRSYIYKNYEKDKNN